MSNITVLAVDLGAESGRVMAVHFDGRRLSLEQLHRFTNPLTTIRGTLHWDILHLWREIQLGIEKGKLLKPASIGADTWGVDFGLLDQQGHLIGNPVNYRDRRTDGMMEAVFSKVPRQEVFAQTGVQFISINTLYHLMSMVESGSSQLQTAHTFLTIPDLLNYFLTGAKFCEFSNATTTQLLNPQTGTWATDMMEKLGIPSHIFPEVIPSGTRLGSYEDIPVIAPACHDTGSAVAAIPTDTAEFAYISSGTWSLVGLETTEAIINDEALAINASNEGGVYGTNRFLKNVMGLWIIQQCRATWAKNDEAISYESLMTMAGDAVPLQSLIFPDDKAFLLPGDHPSIIRSFCKETGQPIPETKGEVIRCVLESLALRYRDVIESLAVCAGQQVSAINIVGGGSQNRLLNQMTADAMGLPVVAGPIEATVIGNAIVQLITLGELKDHREARQLVAEWDPLHTFEPHNKSRWDDAFECYSKLERDHY